MANISIVDLEVFLRVGVSDEERAQPQRLLLSVDMELDISSAAMSDRLSRTIDYYNVAQQLLKYGEGRSWKLIERLTSEVADEVLSQFQPQSVTVEVKKFPIPQARYVSVRLTRSGRGGMVKKAAWGIP